ncbi:MAG: hypothetical protein GYA46_04670 [candidate division Zixibacteria bacterium]|nr:hypothetical protein [candidate division Zixibacteria bacterium]
MGIARKEPISLFVCLALVLTLILFSSLTVTADPQTILVAFGPGLIRKRIALSQVRACRPVRNKWYYGWGVRLIPGGLMFNVANLDAVELDMDNGRIFRIGTDEPEKLTAAISTNIAPLS